MTFSRRRQDRPRSAGRLPAILASVLLLCAVSARAEIYFFPSRGGANDIPSEYVRFDVKEWFSTGSSSFKKSFPFPFATNVPPQDISMGSTLNFNNLSSNVTVFSGEIRPIGWLSAAVDFGSDATGRGTGFDHDWINAPGYNLTSPSGFVYYNPAYEDFSLSQESLAGTFRFTTPTVYVRVAALRESMDSSLTYLHLFDVGLGYTWFDETVNLTNGFQVAAPDAFLNSYIGIPPPGTAFAGLNSSYHFHWEGVRLALREKLIFGPHFSSEGKFGFVPAAQFTGTGIWNLRSDLQQNPSFTQTTTGRGYDFSVDVTYQIIQYVALKAGYMLQYFDASGGTDISHTVASGDVRDTLNSVKSVRSGAFLGASFQF